MTSPLHVLALATAISLSGLSMATAQQPMAPQGVQGDALEELDRRADDLSDAARRTIEEFVNLVGPMMMRLSRLIDGLPTYEMPEILPNGDIIIRRKPEPPGPAQPDAGTLTET